MNEFYSDGYLKELRKSNPKDYVKLQAKRAWNWMVDNKELVVVLIPATVGISKTLVKETNRNRAMKQEKMHRDRTIYDRSLGHYHHLKRTPSKKEWAEMDARKSSGESWTSILTDMRLI